MLPTELLMFRIKAGLFEPRRLKPTTNNLKLAETLIAVFGAHVGKRRADLDDELRDLEAGRSDYRVVRGLAHLLTQRGEFEAGGGLAPAAVREKVFALAQDGPPSRHRTNTILEQAARALSTESPLGSHDIAAALYADLPDQQTLIAFEPLEPLDLIQRWDLAQAQGALYRAFQLVITARRNEPARYKQLLKYLKFFGLMVTVEGDANYGFTLTLDGPDVAVLQQHPLRPGDGEISACPAARHQVGPERRPQAPPGPGLGGPQGRRMVLPAHQRGRLRQPLQGARGARQRPGVGIRRALRQTGDPLATRTGSGPSSRSQAA